MRILFPYKHKNFESSGIRYRQAKISPGKPVLSPDLSWESPRVNLYGSVIKSVRGYEMFYQCGNAMRIGYARSDDGTEWHKPLINPTNFCAGGHSILLPKDTSLTLPTSSHSSQQMTNLVAGYHMPSIILEPASNQPYKMFAFGEGGYHVLSSTDGSLFHPCQDRPAISLLTWKNPHTGKTWVSDVAPCFKDHNGYTAMVKTYVIDDQHRTRRCVGRSTSNNFLDWGPVETLWRPGDKEDAIARSRGYEWADFYGLCPFLHGTGYLGFLWLFEIEKELPHGTNLGKMEVFLVYSPDGLQWSYVAEKPIVPWDLNFAVNGGMVTTPGAPVVDDEGIKLYYSDSNYEHGFAERDFTKKIDAPTWVIRCAELKKERLVGAFAGNGMLRIHHLDLRRQKLRINIAARSGQIFLTYKATGNKIYEQTVQDCDTTDLVLNTPEQEDVSLTLLLKNATLYALELVES